MINECESNVRSYCRCFPVTFVSAKDSLLFTESGRHYIDFFAGAGALNYGHNNDYIKKKILKYLEMDGIVHGLDMFTEAKKVFIDTFSRHILKEKKINHKIQFCGPTGTNAVEAALKIARKATQRTGIFSFMGGFHGMTLGGLAVTGNHFHRRGAGLPLNNVTFMPYPFGFSSSFDTIEYIENVLTDSHSGIEKPAAIIVETIQAEGGVIVAPVKWLQDLRALCTRHNILLICDDIQVGCYRTGTFFSFERAEIIPDIIILSKSISGYGFPMSIVLLRPEIDLWEPGEHSGTFRGNQVAFVGGAAALDYACEFKLKSQVKLKEEYLNKFLNQHIKPGVDKIEVRGLGMIWGIDFSELEDGEITSKISAKCYEDGLIIETAGRRSTVIKLLPPLTIDMDLLQKGCMILKNAVLSCI